MTGQFVSGAEYADYEVVTFLGSAGQTAAENDGDTGFEGETVNFEGLLLVDYDDIVDRNERLELLRASHVLEVYGNSTRTEDGTVGGVVEVSASPSQTTVGLLRTNDTNELDSDDAAVGFASREDSIDLVGRPLMAVTGAPFSDSATGMGGGGNGGGHDQWEGDYFPGGVGAFHPRDELFMNGQLHFWNVDDAGVHLQLIGQHIYGVVAE